MTKLKAKNPELVEPGKTKGVLFGPSGVGKTWFTLSFPAPFYIDTEGGAKLRHYQERLKSAGGVYLGPQDGALDFNFIVDQMKALATEKHPYQTLIVDSVTKLYQTAIANEAERLGEKDAFGASKKPAIAGMRRLVNWAAKLDMNIWFVAHEVTEWGTNPQSGQRQEVGKCADVWDKLIYELDVALHAQKRGPARSATVRKSRLIGFPEADCFPLEYSDFAVRYGKDIIEGEVKQITLASPEQGAEVERLCSVIKVSDDEKDKWFTKAGVDSFSEMDADTITKTIKFLKGKIEK